MDNSSIGNSSERLSTRDQAAAWDAQAPTFDEAPDHGLRDPLVRRAWRALLADLLPAAPARVADLGCGTGTLAALLAGDGYVVDGLDLSGEMVRLAREKTAALPDVSVTCADAARPPLSPGTYDVVLSRHVLWALPDPADVLARWVALLAPGGRLVLIEGSWWTGAGLTAAQTTALVASTGREAELRPLEDPALWGGPIRDERYAVVSAG
ncbi:class I SAM-dependent methyltransferase [Nocardioides ferulae]|uniref:class I SAM-dependent methyltransferase n=1 Tax=Nocardioides ferulae TaxID=2340821 RepID=UPI001F0C7D0D|nr:class I SAM-dependent methyltransferase [Nocardioides ferulae]